MLSSTVEVTGRGYFVQIATVIQPLYDILRGFRVASLWTYTPAGGEVRLTLASDTAQAVFAVEDSGISVPPASRGHRYRIAAREGDHACGGGHLK